MLFPLVVVAVVVALVLAAFVSYALRRRSAEAWREAVRGGVETLSREGRREALAHVEVSPHRVGLESLLADEATNGSAYLRAEAIPGWESALAVEERMSRWQARRHGHVGLAMRHRAH